VKVTRHFLHTARLGAELGLPELRVKDEGANPTGSFKSRGLSAAITRAKAAGVDRFTLPTAGNAGVAAAAYGARAGAEVRVFAPSTTPPLILRQIEHFGATLVLLDGHIGDCGKASRAWAAESGAMDLSTLREPYRIEGKKTLGLEIALQLGWRLPDAIIYPTGGGTGLIGMWKAFQELKAAGWVEGEFPRMFTVQSAGCAPDGGGVQLRRGPRNALARSSDRGEWTPRPGPTGRQDDVAGAARVETAVRSRSRTTS
jgi:threonine synthase